MNIFKWPVAFGGKEIVDMELLWELSEDGTSRSVFENLYGVHEYKGSIVMVWRW